MHAALMGLIDIIFLVADRLLGFFSFLVFVWVICSWLVGFGVINAYNQVVRSILTFLDRCTRWALNPIRNAMPDLGPIDISPIVLLFLIFVVRLLLNDVVRPAVLSIFA